MIYIILLILLAVAATLAIYYKDKAKEFESLFELSKKYEHSGWPDEVMPMLQPAKYDMRYKDFANEALAGIAGIKLNKDGSIAKKRGPKPKNTK